MSRDERDFLESFSACLGVSCESKKTRNEYVVYPGLPQSAHPRGFEEFWDAMVHVVHTASTKVQWLQSSSLS